MDKLVIEGGSPLEGELRISGSKNAGLPILISTLLAPGVHKLSNVPNLVDISSTLSLLGRIGAPSLREEGSEEVQIDTTRISFSEAPYEVVRKMRASVLVLGPLLARMGHARVSLPGGCAIGVRPIDQHLKGLEALGCTFDLVGGYIEGKVDQLRGAEIQLDMPTVGGTENILMAAVLADGITVIENAAREPEVVDLANHLKAMGARIKGAGTSRIEIDGVPALRPPREPYSIMSDRIEAGTYMLGAAMSKGDVLFTNVPIDCLRLFLGNLMSTGVLVEEKDRTIRIKSSERMNPISIETAPHPGFATDMQAQWMAAMSIAHGSCLITERIFENRFMHVPELNRMGASIQIRGNSAYVQGTESLNGTSVMATDLRASASLVLAGLIAAERTEVLRIYHLDRGYDRLVQKLRGVGAKIARVSSDTDAYSVEF
ncbi:MAG: UDP-N-acetylglucosamine 1-carboxyvinyltransferase [Proteobacteria bacterium]|nr:UDP-N-acetylglucosamine 1-carboxyvinyltransferase [Pseudomonadota bacterium]